MADKFYDGMPNVNEKLNEMDRAFAAGPYNALPLTGGTMSGPITTPSFITMAVRGPGQQQNVGLSNGWWRIAKFNVAALSGEATIRISGATSYSSYEGSSNGIETVILLRCDNDGKIRGSWYSIGDGKHADIQGVKIGSDGVIYVGAVQFSTLSCYIDSNMWFQQKLEFLGTELPKDSWDAIAVYALSVGGAPAMTVRPGAVELQTNSTLNGPKTIHVGLRGGQQSSLLVPNGGNPLLPNTYYEVGALGVGGIAGAAFPGRFLWSTSAGSGSLYYQGYKMNLRAYDENSGNLSAPLLGVTGTGQVAWPGNMRCGPASTGAAARDLHTIYKDTTPAGEILYVGRTGEPATATLAVLAGAGTASWAGSTAVLYVGLQTTGRSINAAGTINASGADYAEYMLKSPACGIVAAGQVIGIGADGKLTDRWADAISFAVKSTDPCMVGGDKWSQRLGPRPPSVTRVPDSVESQLVSEAQPAVEAVYDGLTLLTPAIPAKAAVYREVPLAGDTDEEWAVRQAPGFAFDAALEALRQTVDRIAFAGQVPCNVLGATSGQFIVPVQQGEGIAGIAINEEDMTLQQYMRAIGKVIAIEDDGRARVIVKVA
ncbi:hypothetical protein [Janthinobacterium sp. LM6]|uniref:hypothetical protein n=1 Tax=Janthinobacterium sp. LM6 TaxID=1938606 RepID=UPI0012378B07|nr:hypothetical protein [Janthinobacterium sp. LM6]